MIAGWMNRRQQEVIEYLLEENRVLKDQFDKTGKKLRLDDTQRRALAKKGKRLGWNLLKQYANLVTPETLLAWHRKLIALKYTAKRMINTERQKRMEIIRELCVKFSEENPGWGYGRIQGVLKNLGYKISNTTVGNILRAKGVAPSPDRTNRSNWKRFIRSHMDVTAVADFLTVEVWTLRGLVRYQVFFVMTLGKRQVEIAHIGCQVDGEVMKQVARNLTDCVDGYLKGMRFLVCDRDSLYTRAFKEVLKSAGVRVIQTRVGCPEQNGYAERFVKSIKRECLDHLIFFGEQSLRKAVEEYVKHYHHERNHQGLDNLIPFPYAASQAGSEGLIVKSDRLGGLLNYYHRQSEPQNEKEAQEAA